MLLQMVTKNYLKTVWTSFNIKRRRGVVCNWTITVLRGYPKCKGCGAPVLDNYCVLCDKEHN